MSERPQLADDFKALGNPVRLRVLEEVEAGMRSASRVAEALDISVKSADYHLKALYVAALVQRDGERKVRGATERFWKLTPRGERLLSSVKDL